MKKSTKTVRKTAAKTVKKQIAQNRTYSTPIWVIEEKYGLKTGLPPNTKLGDVLKKNGFHVAVRMLGG